MQQGLSDDFVCDFYLKKSLIINGQKTTLKVTCEKFSGMFRGATLAWASQVEAVWSGRGRAPEKGHKKREAEASRRYCDVRMSS